MRGEPIIRSRRTGKLKVRLGRREFEIPEHVAAVSLFVILSVLLLWGASRPLSLDRTRVQTDPSMRGAGSFKTATNESTFATGGANSGAISTEGNSNAIADTKPLSGPWANLLATPLVRFNASGRSYEDAAIDPTRPVLLFYGASWCSATKDFMPTLQNFYQRATQTLDLGGGCATVLHVPSDRNADELQGWAAQTFSPQWRSLPDPGASVVTELKKQVCVCVCFVFSLLYCWA